jgi:hypothetical protein
VVVKRKNLEVQILQIKKRELKKLCEVIWNLKKVMLKQKRSQENNLTFLFKKGPDIYV